MGDEGMEAMLYVKIGTHDYGIRRDDGWLLCRNSKCLADLFLHDDRRGSDENYEDHILSHQSQVVSEYLGEPVIIRRAGDPGFPDMVIAGSLFAGLYCKTEAELWVYPDAIFDE